MSKTDSYDECCCRFLPVLFEHKSIHDFNIALLMKELKHIQIPEFYKVISKRWEAIQSYFLGDIATCVSLLAEALSAAKNNNLPDWILIDLRNQNRILEQSQNKYLIEDDAQKELNQSEYALYYPLLDRFNVTAQ